MNAPSRPILAVINGHATTTSNQIAEHFGKNHKSVLRTIRTLDCSPEFTGRNFAPSEFIDSTNRTLPAYTITRDGFVFLAMGFTGKEAAQWKEAYIEAFNAMETTLKQIATPEVSPSGYSMADNYHIAGLTCAERTAQQAIVLSENILTQLADKSVTIATRVACYTASISLINSAVDTLTHEQERFCQVLENIDGSSIGDSTKWPKPLAMLHFGRAPEANKTASQVAVEGGEA